MGCSVSSNNGVLEESELEESTSAALSPTTRQIIKEHSSFRLTGNQNVLDTYTIQKQIGSGNFGVVFEAIHNATGVLYAIKKMDKEKIREPDNLMKEMGVLLRVNHPNIVSVVDVIQDSSAVYIVQDFCAGGELFDRIVQSGGGFNERNAASLIGQVLSGIAHCHHDVGIAHRDLKPDNILFKTSEVDSEIMIIDFGLAESVSTTMAIDQDLKDAPCDHLELQCGTPMFMAPEVFQKNYSRSCDLWSIGVITYMLLCGYPPYNGENEEEIISKVTRARPVKFPPEDWDHISDEALAFIKRLLQKDASKRPSALEALKDPWFGVQAVSTHEHNKVKSRLGTYHSMNKLKKMASMVIVGEGIVTETKEMRSMFSKIDINKTGHITRDQLHAALLDGGDSMGNIKNEDFDAIFGQLDQDGEGTIDYEEFLAAIMKPAVRQNHDNIRIAFDYFDTNKDGAISVKELEAIVGSTAQARLLIGEVDVDQDQTISFSEFMAMMLKPDFKTILSDCAISDQKAAAIATEWMQSNKDSMEQDLHFSQTIRDMNLGLKLSIQFESPNQVMVVHHVDHNSPAKKAGVRPLHILLKIDGVLTNEMSLEDAYEKMEQAVQEESGCTVTVGVLPSNQLFQRAIGSNVEGIQFGVEKLGVERDSPRNVIWKKVKSVLAKR